LGVRIRRDVALFRREFEIFSRGILFVLQKQDLIHAQAAEDHELKSQVGQIHRLREISGSMAWLNATYGLLHAFLFAAAGTVVLAVGGIEVVRGRMTTGTLVSFFVTLGLLRTQMGIVSTSLPLIVGGRASLEAVLDLLRLPASAPTSARPPLSFQGRIALEDVTYGYDRMLGPVLHEVSLTLASGEAVALVGRNGAGKTTLLNLILGFDEPWSGRLLADGIPYGAFDIVSMRRRTGTVLQDPLVVRGTLAENVSYGTPGATRLALSEAARLAFLDGIVAKLPSGWETPVGDDGGTLSGGVRQRIAIARAILADPRILILDDATSSVDASTEQEIKLALREVMADRTTFVIAHRLSTIALADHIFVLEDGRLATEGSHDELLERSELYREIVEKGMPDQVFMTRKAVGATGL
jgi:ATP-binding cassette subfamily B protein